MLNIINILKEFSREEIKNLERFLDSPYHNKSKKVKLYFKEIKKFYPKFLNKNLNKKYLNKRISPLSEYNDSTFRNLTADLQNLIDKFLVIEELFQSKYDRNTLLLKSLIDKKQEKLFDIHLKKTLNQLKKNGIDHNYHYSKSLIELCQFNNNIINRRERTIKNIKENTDCINNYIICLSNFFVTEIVNSHLKLAVEGSKFNIKGKSEFSLGLIESINIKKISHLIKNIDKNNFILDLYLHLLLTFQYIEDKQHYLNYRLIITKYHKQLSRDELSYHYSILITYCVIKNAHSHSKLYYDTELFGIYNSFLKEKLFIDNKSHYINEGLYRNIVVLSLRLKKFSWTFDFIQHYSKYLHPQKSQNMINLSFAEYYYHLGCINNSSENFNKAFNYLKEIQEELFIIKYDIKILYLMLYYDLDYRENLLTQLYNYRKFLCRNKLVPTDRKKKLNRFLNILEKLIYLKEKNPKIDIAKVNVDIINFKDFNYQGWLFNKIQTFNIKTPYTKLKNV